jgi:hypothetical protein
MSRVIVFQTELGRDGLSKKETKKLAALYKKATVNYAKAVDVSAELLFSGHFGNPQFLRPHRHKSVTTS